MASSALSEDSATLDDGPRITCPMLDYEKEIFVNVYEKDGLVILAKGLNYHNIVSNLLWVYKDPVNLVLVVNSSDHEEKYFMQRLKLKPLPLIAGEREKRYLEGGVYVISTRVLVVDLLKRRCPAENITGIIVLRGHTLSESRQEAFALRLYRDSNKTGFVKAFSSSPESFTFGFHHVERVMRTLFLSEVYLWPRFHGKVIQSLRIRAPEVVELRVALTTNMLQIQHSLLDIINYILKQVKAINRTVDLQEVTLESCMSERFHKILQRQLDPVWYRLCPRSKDYIQDLRALRSIGHSLLHCDAVTFHSRVREYGRREYAVSSSGWVLLDSAERLFTLARARVYNHRAEFDPEPSPKWKCLTDLLAKEIPEHARDNRSDVKDVKILILCRDTGTCRQLHEILSEGPGRYLLRRAMSEGACVTSLAGEYRDLQTSDSPEDSPDASVYTLTQDASVRGHDGEALVRPTITIQTFKDHGDPFSLELSVASLVPDYIVMYHSDVFAVRVLETTICGMNVTPRVYIMSHDNSVEEQTYLTSLRREKSAFEHLIRAKSEMAAPADRADESSSASGTVVVDSREFRCELPALLHRRGLRVSPLTIAVGDYVLSPEVCVERKSVADLAASLGGGRMYAQCRRLCRAYRAPVLLVEFEGAFALHAHAAWSEEARRRLQLLTLHFPRLKLVWSPSPYASAELFEELKRGRGDPDEEALRGEAAADGESFERCDPGVLDLLRRLAGVTHNNVHRLVNRGRSFVRLLATSRERLCDLLESKTEADELYNILHEPLRHREKRSDVKNKYVRKFRHEK